MFKNFKFTIKLKIYLYTALMFSLVFLSVFWVYYQLVSAKELIKENRVSVQQLNSFGQLATRANSLDLNLENYFIIGGQPYEQAVLNDLGGIIKIVDEGPQIDNPGIDKNMKELRVLVIELRDLIKGMAASQAYLSADQLNRSHVKVFDLVGRIDLLNKALYERINIVIQDIIINSERLLNGVLVDFIYIGFVFLFVSALFSFLLSNNISCAITNLRDAAYRFGEGDYDIKLEAKTRDEIGDLTKAFKHMMENVVESKREQEEYARKLEKAVAERTRELRAEVEKLKKYNDLVVDRELRMVKLKQELEELGGNKKEMV